jgi:lipid-binding SYLF domain-containing protein
MKTRTSMKRSKILNGFLTAVFLATILCVAGFAQMAFAETAKEIDASADAALDRFYKQVKGSEELAREAKALLIMPNVKKAGFIVGAEYGKGALRIGGKTVDYYRLMSGSFGFEIGAESKDIVILFMKDDALNSFRANKDWEAGVDGNVAIVTVGGGASVTTMNVKEPISGFVFDVKGLMGDISLKGAKFSKMDMSQ